VSKGFWTHIEEVAPSVPGGGGIAWSMSSADLAHRISAGGLLVTAADIDRELSNAAKHNSGWSRRVHLENGVWHFTPA